MLGGVLRLNIVLNLDSRQPRNYHWNTLDCSGTARLLTLKHATVQLQTN